MKSFFEWKMNGEFDEKLKEAYREIKICLRFSKL